MPLSVLPALRTQPLASVGLGRRARSGFFAAGLLACLIPTLSHAAPPQPEDAASPAATPATTADAVPSIIRSVVHHRASNVYTISLRGQRVLVHLRPMPEATGISLCIRLLGGELSETAQTRGLTAAVVSAWTRPETDTPAQGINLRSAVTPESIAFTPRTLESPDALGKALANFASMLASPTLDETRFSSAHRQTLSRARAAGSPGFAAVVQAMRQSTDPRAGGPLPTHVERWNLDLAREHLAALATAAPIEIAIAGNITLAQALPIIERALAPVSALEPAAPVNQPSFSRSADRDIAAGVVAAAFPVPDGPIVQVLLPGPDIEDLAAVRQCAVVAQYLQSELDSTFKAQPRPASVIGSVVIPSRGLKNLGSVMLTIRLKNPEPVPTLADNADNQPSSQTFPQPEAIAAEVRSALEAVLTRCADAKQIDQPRLTAAIDAITAQASQRLNDPDYWSSVLSFTRFYAINPDELAHAARQYRGITPADVASRIAALGPGTTRTRFVVLVPPPPTSPKQVLPEKAQAPEDR